MYEEELRTSATRNRDQCSSGEEAVQLLYGNSTSSNAWKIRVSPAQVFNCIRRRAKAHLSASGITCWMASNEESACALQLLRRGGLRALCEARALRTRDPARLLPRWISS